MGKSRSSERQQVTIQRQNRVRSILKALGLWESLKETTLAHRLLNCHYPRISVGLADGCPKTDETDKIIRSLNKTIDEVTVDCPPFGKKYPAVDVLSFVMPVIDTIQSAITADRSLVGLVKEAKSRTSGLISPGPAFKALLAVCRKLDDKIDRYCRIDSRIYYLKLSQGWTEDQRFRARFLLHMDQPRVRRVTTETGPRNAYWCGSPYGPRGIQWVCWPRPLVGLPGEGPDLPVYVQSHALDNLYRREARALFIRDGEWIVHDYLFNSLNKPVVIPMPSKPGKFLVEYRLSIHKIGYLVARPVDDLVLIETFLFLTMDDTPEGDLLWKKLRLRKKDKMLLELDRIETFLHTDVQFDPGLVEILKDCGCGHLFHILKEPPLHRHYPGYAEKIRKYLRLD